MGDSDVCGLLHSIFQRSTIKYADVHAGRINGKQIQYKWTAPDAAFAHPTAAECERVYLVASITKPVVAMRALQFAAEGKLSLNERIGDHLPPFDRGKLRRITLRHLLTHTSGLPDMLPDNEQLRVEHSPLEAFVNATATCDPEFAPGTESRYSSMGFAVLAQVLEQVGGTSISEQLRESFFQPLAMKSSWLGFPQEEADALISAALPCQLPFWQQDASDWHWNSRYWRTLGAPWGGLLSTAEDLARFARMLVSNGLSMRGDSVLPVSVINAGLQDQLSGMVDVPESTRRSRPWGFGWRLNWQDHSACFGDFLPADVAGHWGATGTLIWVWPAEQMYAVVLTTEPYEQSRVTIQRVSNVVCAALATNEQAHRQ